MEDLQGALMEVSVTQERTIRRDGKELPNKFRMDWKIRFNAVDSISVSSERISYGLRNTNRTKEKESVKNLARPTETKLRGGGHTLWIFEDDALTFLRTYQGGGLKATFAVTRGATGFDCTAKVSWLREESAPIVMRSFVDDARLEILSARQVASTCRVITHGEAASR
jgi:lipoprotein-anchoring transpeptidase ErfK/SrfK